MEIKVEYFPFGIVKPNISFQQPEEHALHVPNTSKRKSFDDQIELHVEAQTQNPPQAHITP